MNETGDSEFTELFHQRRERTNAPYFRLSVELTVSD